MRENVTVLKDEALGGVEREYREVKRKAAVGERIKVSKGCDKFYSACDIATVSRAGASGVYGNFNGNQQVCDDGVWYVGESDIGYVVLEPTDIVRIEYTLADGKGTKETRRFRMVERKAAVGDRVLITKSEEYGTGVVAECTYDGEFSDGSIDVRLPSGGRGFIDRAYEKYVVLESVTPVAKLAANVSVNVTLPPNFAETLAGLVDTVAKLSVKVAELERNMPKMTSAEFAEAATKALSAIGSLRAKLTRDDVVERAKADVAELLRTDRSVPFRHISFWPQVDGEKADWIPLQYVEFVVNREKRTVAALIKYLPKYYERKLYAKGIAKCAPGDVFNSHIGRAIALRRALGLEVPDEYVNAPAPTEVRVGDIIHWSISADSLYKVVRGNGGKRSFKRLTTGKIYPDDYAYITPGKNVFVIDDSREDGTEVGA